MNIQNKNWQDKRIKAIDRLIFRRKTLKEYLQIYFVDEYVKISSSKAENKKQYKEENKNDNYQERR
jgi:arylsulfatase A-like enzyme